MSGGQLGLGSKVGLVDYRVKWDGGRAACPHEPEPCLLASHCVWDKQERGLGCALGSRT